MANRDIARALADFVGRQVEAHRVDVVDCSRLAGGAIQSNYALTVDCAGGTMPGRHELVARTDAPSQIDVSLSREHEFHVLQVAHQAGVAVPEPLWLCTDASVIGVAFCIMRRAPGSADGRTLVRSAMAPERAAALTRQLGQELARLHTIRPPHPRLGFLPMLEKSPASARVDAYRRALSALPDPHPSLEFALNWLHVRAPHDYDVTLCHGDFRTGNYMVQEGRLTAVLDWDFAGWSDPYEDLGWLCSASWRFGARGKEVGGVGHKQDLFDGYAGIAGLPVDPHRVLYWEVMGMTRWAIIALQQAQRHLSGRENSLELALTGRLLPEIEFDILTQIKGLGGMP